MTWSSSNAFSAHLDHGIGPVPLAGSRTVTNITQTTTYTLTVTGFLGSVATCQTTIIVQTPPNLPSCILSANPTTVQSGGSSTLTWTSQNAVSARINRGIGPVALNGSQTVSNIVQTTTYTLTVTSASGQSVTCQTTVTVQAPPNLPSCTISANPTTVQSGGSSTLSWTSQNAVNASISPNIGPVALNGSQLVSNITQTTTYTLTVTDSLGRSANCQTTITVQTPPGAPSCTLSANPTIVQNGGSSTLTWTSQNAVSASISPNIGSVAVNGSQTVSNITSNVTYTLTVVSASGQSAQCQTSIVVQVQPNLPSCVLSASPTSINQGGSSVLSWSSTNATSAFLSPPGNSVALSGSQTVYPAGTTTYVLTVTDSQGRSAVCQTTVVVNPITPQAPSCTLSANPMVISPGQSSTLSWSSTNAVSAFLSSIGAVAPYGSLSVNPTISTTYTLTVTSSSGQTAICQTAISVSQYPIIPPPPIYPPKYPPIYPPTVSLHQIPYTGFDYGPVGNILYLLALGLLGAGGGYAIFFSSGKIARRMRNVRHQIDEVLNRTTA